MTTDEIPQKLNLALSFSVISLLAFQILLMPALLPHYLIVSIFIVLLLIPINSPLWSLIHEAIHNKLHPRKHTNELLGRVLSIMFGASFTVLRFGHIMHHRFNREWESEYYDPLRQNALMVHISHYAKILGGLYLTEVLMTFILALTPLGLAKKLAAYFFPAEAHEQAVLNALLKEKNIRKIRMDAFFIFILYGSGFYLFGAYWPLLVLLLAGRALVISLMDNAYHYGTPLDNSVPAKELRAPALLEKFILNFNHHLTHHENTQISWIHLKDHHTRKNQQYSEDLIPALLGQFKGPIRHGGIHFPTITD